MKDLRYIGIDDTDNLETRGTGYRARQLIELLQGHNLAQGVAVTRHQLLVDDRVPYTSHNSSACIVVKPQDRVSDDQLLEFCRGFLLDIAAEGADVGLCLAGHEQAREVVRFGIKAKTELVQQDEAHAVAHQSGIRLEGLTGTHQGVIGSLSAVGLHVQGNDGRYLWPREIREYAGQTVAMPFLKHNLGIDRISLLDGNEVNDESAQVSLGDWPRTVRIDHHAVLLVEPFNVQHQYKVLEKTVLKAVRP
ncbi:MAG: ABC transporter substrate-binding protein [Gammaproteobacteria bacterium]